MTIRNLILALSCAAFISACTQSNPMLKDRQDYIGTWKNDQSELIIRPSGEVSYEHKAHTEKEIANQTFSGTEADSIKAKITSFNDQGFSIGEGDLHKQFAVNQPPHQNQGKWTMTVNGESYTRK